MRLFLLEVVTYTIVPYKHIETYVILIKIIVGSCTIILNTYCWNMHWNHSWLLFNIVGIYMNYVWEMRIHWFYFTGINIFFGMSLARSETFTGTWVKIVLVGFAILYVITTVVLENNKRRTNANTGKIYIACHCTAITF